MTTSPSSDDVRVQFDAEITFRNGGGLTATGFRLDADSPEVDEDALAAVFVRHLGLLMVDTVTLSNVTVIHEQHMGSRGTGSGTGAGAAAPGPRRIIELSHPIHDGMVTYPGLPAPEVSDHLSREASHGMYAPGTEFQIGRISMVANTGTYLDTPFHRFGDGPDLGGVGLEKLADLDAIVVRIGHEGTEVSDPGRAVDVPALAPYDVTGRAVLIHTGWDRHWGTEQYGSGNPFLTPKAAEWLAAQRPALVGIDSLNIDDTADPTRPAHTALLAAGIPIVEHMCGLEQLPSEGFRFHAAPPKVVGMGTFPVRAYAVIGEAEPAADPAPDRR